VARMISDVAVMRTAVADALTGIGGSFLTLLFLIGIMVYQDWALSLAVMTLLPLASFFIMRLGRRLRKISRTLQQQNATLADRLIQIFQGIRQVKAYGTEDHERARAAEAILSVRDLNIRSMNVSALITPFNEFLVGATIFGMLVYGGLRIVEGHLTAGELLSFITAFSLAYEPMKKLAKLNSTLQIGLGAAERVFDMIDTQRAIVDRPGARAVHLEKAPAIVFDNVSFRYDESDPDVLNGMDFTVQPGQVTALVGRSGGGKSTVLNLILRFYEIGAGRVLLDGNDINDITLASLRSQMALVSQDITLFDESVADNIAYAAPGASRERVMEAAKAAQAHDFIMNLPDGYDTKLGEQGMRLSGGQRQRISIARALLKNAPVLLLDEATSALDAESEQAVQASLDLLGRGRTTLVIAHRLTTIQKADRILVVEQGRIAQSGTHSELLKSGGIYADLYEGMLHEK